MVAAGIAVLSESSPVSRSDAALSCVSGLVMGYISKFALCEPGRRSVGRAGRLSMSVEALPLSPLSLVPSEPELDGQFGVFLIQWPVST